MDTGTHALSLGEGAAPPLTRRGAEVPRRVALRSALWGLWLPLETACVALTLFVLSDALLPLVVKGTGGGVSATQVNSALREVVLLVDGVIAVLVLVRLRSVVQASFNHKPTLLLAAFALLSAAWSVAPDETVRRGLALAVTTAFGVYLAVRYSPRELLQVLGWTLGAAAVLSLFFVLALPEYGLGRGDHAGQWRGIFPHKNTLAQTMVLSALVSFLLWKSAAPRRRWVFLGICALSLALVLGSQSASGLMVLGILALLLPLFAALRWRSDRMIPVLIFTVLVGGIATVLVVPNLDVLLALTGKDTTLTGRTLIWTAVWDAIRQHPWLGHGYGAFWLGSRGGSGGIWDAVQWRTPHAHNGFLDLWLELGLVGVAILLLGVASAAARGVSALRRGVGAEGLWPLVFLSFVVLYNLSESAILQQNSILWVLYVATVSSAWLRREAAQPAEEAPSRPHQRLSPGVRRRAASLRRVPHG